MSVFSVVKLRVKPSGELPLLAKALDVLKEESTTLDGFIAGNLLVSLDSRTVVVLTEWVDRHSWSRSRYDSRVGEMLEDCFTESPEVEFEVYNSQAQFRGPV